MYCCLNIESVIVQQETRKTSMSLTTNLSCLPLKEWPQTPITTQRIHVHVLHAFQLCMYGRVLKKKRNKCCANKFGPRILWSVFLLHYGLFTNETSLKWLTNACCNRCIQVNENVSYKAKQAYIQLIMILL